MTPYQGGSSAVWSREKKCEACQEVIQSSTKQLFGSGRFCSSLCAQLRTPEKHFDWLVAHPDEYKAWQEKHNKSIGALGPDVVFPVAG